MAPGTSTGTQRSKTAGLAEKHKRRIYLFAKAIFMRQSRNQKTPFTYDISKEGTQYQASRFYSKYFKIILDLKDRNASINLDQIAEGDAAAKRWCELCLDMINDGVRSYRYVSDAIREAQQKLFAEETQRDTTNHIEHLLSENYVRSRIYRNMSIHDVLTASGTGITFVPDDIKRLREHPELLIDIMSYMNDGDSGMFTKLIEELKNNDTYYYYQGRFKSRLEAIIELFKLEVRREGHVFKFDPNTTNKDGYGLLIYALLRLYEFTIYPQTMQVYREEREPLHHFVRSYLKLDNVDLMKRYRVKNDIMMTPFACSLLYPGIIFGFGDVLKHINYKIHDYLLPPHENMFRDTYPHVYGYMKQLDGEYIILDDAYIVNKCQEEHVLDIIKHGTQFSWDEIRETIELRNEQLPVRVKNFQTLIRTEKSNHKVTKSEIKKKIEALREDMQQQTTATSDPERAKEVKNKIREKIKALKKKSEEVQKKHIYLIIKYEAIIRKLEDNIAEAKRFDFVKYYLSIL